MKHTCYKVVKRTQDEDVYTSSNVTGPCMLTYKLEKTTQSVPPSSIFVFSSAWEAHRAFPELTRGHDLHRTVALLEGYSSALPFTLCYRTLHLPDPEYLTTEILEHFWVRLPTKIAWYKMPIDVGASYCGVPDFTPLQEVYV